MSKILSIVLENVRAKSAALGVKPNGNAPEKFALVIKSDLPKWARVVKNSGAKPD